MKPSVVGENVACLFLQACHMRSGEQLQIVGLQCPRTCSSYRPFMIDPERTLRRIAFISSASAVLIQPVLALLFSGDYYSCPTKSCFEGVLRLHVCIHAVTVHPRLLERAWFQSNHMGCCFEACLSLPLEEYAQSC